MRTEQIFSTAAAKIQIAGQDIGLIQNLTVQETFNTRRLKTLWSRQNVGFIPGTEDISISAAKAFIELDSILFLPSFWSGIIGSLVSLTGLPNLGSLPLQIGNQLGAALSNSAASVATTSAFNALGSGATGATSPPSLQDFLVANSNTTVAQLIRTALSGLLNGTISLGTVFAIADFDIMVQGPTVGTQTMQGLSSNNIAQTAYGPLDTTNSTILYDLFRFKDCRLVGRSLNFDVRNVVVMEEVEIYCQDWMESYEKYVAQPTVMSNALSKLM